MRAHFTFFNLNPKFGVWGFDRKSALLIPSRILLNQKMLWTPRGHERWSRREIKQQKAGKRLAPYFSA
jgi:hypothetical protein